MKNRKVVMAAATMAAAMMMQRANAATLSWDPNSTGGAALGGDGTWDLSTGTGRWYNAGQTDWTDGSDALFTGTLGNVTVGAPVAPNSIKFDVGGYVLSGSAITTPLIQVKDATTATINDVISGASLTVGVASSQAYDGVLILGAAGNYTGTTTINSGTVKLGVDNAIPIGTTLGSSSNPGGTLDLNGFNQTVATLNGAGQGTVTNTNATTSTFTIGTIANASMVLNGNMNVTKTGTGSWTPASDNGFTGTLWLQGGGTITVNGSTKLGSASGLIRLDGSTALTLNSANALLTTTYTRNLEIVSGSTTAISSLGGDRGITWSGNLLGSGPLAVNSSTGALILSGNNSAFTGTISMGNVAFLVAASNTAFGAGATSITTGTSAEGIGLVGGVSVARNMAFAGAIRVDGLGDMHSFGGDNTYSGTITPTNKISLGAEAGSSLLMTGSIGGGGSRAVNKVGAGTVTIAWNAAATPYQGGTSILQGTYREDFSQATSAQTNMLFPTGAMTFAGGILSAVGKPTIINSQSFSTTVIKSGDSAVTANLNSAASLVVNLAGITRNVGGTMDFTLPTGTQSTTNGITTTTSNTNGILGGYATVGGASWASSGSSGANPITPYVHTTNGTNGDQDAGAFTVASNNVDVNAGNSNQSSAAALITVNSLRFNDNTGPSNVQLATLGSPPSLTLTSGGILVTSNVGNNATAISGGAINGASGKDLVIIQNNAPTTPTGTDTIATRAMTISSNIQDNGAATGLTKSGAGELVLSGTNNYSGITTLNGGVTKLSSAGALSSGSLIDFHGGILGLTTASGDFTRALGATGATVEFHGSGGWAAYGGDRTVNIGGNATPTSLTWNNSGYGDGQTAGSGAFIPSNFSLIFSAADADSTVIFKNPIALGGSVAIQTRILQVDDGSAAIDARMTGALSGDGGIIKTGAGTLELNATETFTAASTISAGTLLVTGSINGNGTNVPSLTVNSGATLAIGALPTAVVGSAGSVTGLITDNGNVSINLSTGLTLSRVISGNGAFTLVANNSGTVTLTGANTFTGATTVTGGTLQIGNAGTSGLWVGDIADNAAVVFSRTDTSTYVGAISGNGTVTKLSSGLLVLTSTGSNYSGATTVSGGLLGISADSNLGNSSSVTLTGGGLQFESTTPLSNTRAITIGAGNGTLDSNGNNVTVGGQVIGGGALTKKGLGTVTFTNTGNNYAGGTTVSAGVLAVSDDAALGGGGVTLTGAGTSSTDFGTLRYAGTNSSVSRAITVAPGIGGAVEVTGSNTVTLTNAVNGSGNGTLRKLGTGTLNTPQLSLNTGGVTVTGGTLAVTGNALTNVVGSVGPTNGTIGVLDMGNSAMIVHGQGGTLQGSVSSLNALVKGGRNGGTWDGNGITTSRANAQTGVTGIGVNDAQSALAIGGIGQPTTATFGGQTVGVNDVLVKYTYVGDENLDGSITGDDYVAIDAGFASHGALTGYGNGDLNYDGKINADDYFLIDRNYSEQSNFALAPSPALGSSGTSLSGVSAVPEPGSLSLIAIGAAGMLRRRRRVK